MADQTTPEHRRAHAAPPAEVDVAIVGAGLGGLVAGAYLARAGRRVAIFDGHYVAGGCATQFSRGPKRARYHFDIGLHYVGDCREDGMIPTILRDLGTSVEFVPMDQDGFDTLVFPDLRFRIPASVETYRARLVSLFPESRRGIDKYVRALEAVMRLSHTMDAGKGITGISHALQTARDALTLRTVQDATIGAFLDDAELRDPRLRAVLLGQNGNYGLAPGRVSALLHFGLCGHYFRGAYYPKGGGQVIADRVADAVESAGGTIHLRRPVERVVVRDGRAVGVRLEARAGEDPVEVRAKVVLSNADLRRTLEDLVGAEHLPASWVERARSFEMAAALFIAFVGVKGDLRAKGMSASNIWQFDGYDMEGFYRDLGGEMIQPYGCYVTSATMKDPDTVGHHAPDGVTNVEVMTVVPPVGPRWGVDPDDAVRWRYRETAVYRERKRAVEDDMIARLDRLFPGAASDVVFRESATPVTHARYTRATDGTGYGLAATPAQFMKRRPGYRGPLEGLFFCGASTRAGHGIVGSMMGGRRAAAAITKSFAP